VDIVLDRTHGPLLLELNARPGLAIQIANRSGLKLRLDAIDTLESIPKDPVERCALAVSLFDGA
jgi:D-alanine-D-alanine ligase-like ATP-grasp enzyme